MYRRLSLAGLLACFVVAGCGDSQPQIAPPPAQHTTIADEGPLPESPPEPAEASKLAPDSIDHAVSKPAEKSTPAGEAPSPEATPPAPPAEPAAPNSGRALGNAVRRALGIPLPSTSSSEPSPQPKSDSGKP